MVCLIVLALLGADSPSKEADIRHLMEMTGMSQLGAQISDQLMTSFKAAFPKVPEGVWKEVKGELKPEELVAQLVPVYDRHFTQDEIKGLIAFYETPLGKKLVKELPLLTAESLETGQVWGRAQGERTMKLLESKGYRLPPPK